MQNKNNEQPNKTSAENFIEYIDLINYQLREPVTNIFASLPLLAENINNLDTEKAIDSLHAIYKRTYSIIKSVNNMSVVSKLESGHEFKKEIINFSQFLKNMFSSAQVVLPEYFSAELNIDNDCIICGNHSLLSVGLLNILVNSFDYRKEDDVKVSITLKNEGKRCVLTYRDNSIGIKPEVIQGVYDLFYSKNPYNDDEITNRMGMGLYLAKQAVAHAKGTILMQSEFGSGVNIVISVPYSSDLNADTFKSSSGEYLLNKYSDMFVQLCEYCNLPDLT